MAERHPLADREQPVRRRRRPRRRRDPEPLGTRAAAAADRRPARPPRPAADAARRRGASRVVGRSSPRSVPRAPARPSRPKPPASCVAVNPRGSSSNASGLPRVSATIRSRTRSSSVNRTAELSSARASPLTQAVHLELGHVPELLARLARGEHDPDRLRQQAPGDERERQRRGLIQPLRVIDDAQQRTLLGRLRDSRLSTASPTRNRSGAAPGAQPEHDLAARPAAGPGAARADRAAARTADAGWRRPAPSPTPPPPPGRRSDPTPTRPGTPAAPSSRSPPRRAAPATGSRPGGSPRPSRPAGRTRDLAPPGSCAPPSGKRFSTGQADPRGPATGHRRARRWPGLSTRPLRGRLPTDDALPSVHASDGDIPRGTLPYGLPSAPPPSRPLGVRRITTVVGAWTARATSGYAAPGSSSTAPRDGRAMSFASRGFRGRRRPEGADAARIPPGQHLTRDFPVLSAGPTPETPLEEWTFSIIAGDEAPDLDLGRDARAAERDGHQGHPLRDALVQARHRLGGRLGGHAARGDRTRRAPTRWPSATAATPRTSRWRT